MKTRVEIRRNCELDRLALYVRTIPERRHTVTFADSDEIFTDENHDNTQNNEVNVTNMSPISSNNSLNSANRSILKKISKYAPFHVRGRRKSTSSLPSLNLKSIEKNTCNVVFHSENSVSVPSNAEKSVPVQSNALLTIADNYGGSESDDD